MRTLVLRHALRAKPGLERSKQGSGVSGLVGRALWGKKLFWCVAKTEVCQRFVKKDYP